MSLFKGPLPGEPGQTLAKYSTFTTKLTTQADGRCSSAAARKGRIWKFCLPAYASQGWKALHRAFSRGHDSNYPQGLRERSDLAIVSGCTSNLVELLYCLCLASPSASDIASIMGFFSKPFLQYPSMERQDLTQSQLGSFKFTPVDAVRKEINQEYLTALAHEEMLGQLQYSAQRAVAMASVTPSRASFDFAITSATNLAAHNNLQIPHSGSSFFNKHIKPDLEDSRLRYGPAALRSAVESHSPKKTRTQVCEYCRLQSPFTGPVTLKI
jgi:hypothetical protein